MKIYFEDGELYPYNSIKDLPYSDLLYTVDAAKGVSACMNTAEYLMSKKNPEIVIYTNCLELFHNRYAWNEVLKVPEAYIRHKDTGHFIRIDEATDRDLREGHNLPKMYLSGEFDDVTNALDNPPVIDVDR